MTIENILKAGFLSAALATSTNANAHEAQEATKKQIASVIESQENAHNASKENKEDWSQQQKLMYNGATILIKPVKNEKGYCFFGLDGFPQKYDLPADSRTKDGKLEKAEMLLNLAETNPDRKFYFPCDLIAKEEQPKVKFIPGPERIVEKTEEVSAGDVTVGLGYVMVKTPAEELYNFEGFLHGGKVWVHFQPRDSRWYFGPEVMFYGNEASATQDVEVPAVDGPLANQLVMRGTNNYSLGLMGIGAGFTGGVMVANGDKFRFGVELQSGLMHDWMTRELIEKSAHYINGRIVEGTDISNTTADNESNFNVYNAIALHPEFYGIGVTVGAGARTNFVGTPEPVFNAGLSYRF